MATVDLIAKMASQWVIGGEQLQHGDVGPKDDSHPGLVRFHYSTQNSVQLESYQLFLSEIFHLISLCCG